MNDDIDRSQAAKAAAAIYAAADAQCAAMWADAGRNIDAATARTIARACDAIRSRAAKVAAAAFDGGA